MKSGDSLDNNHATASSKNNVKNKGDTGNKDFFPSNSILWAFLLFIVSLCYFRMLTGAHKDDYSAAQLPTKEMFWAEVLMLAGFHEVKEKASCLYVWYCRDPSLWTHTGWRVCLPSARAKSSATGRLTSRHVRITLKQPTGKFGAVTMVTTIINHF